jgi:hypothetical protein
MRLALAALALAAALAGCAPIGSPGATDRVEFVGSSVVDGFKWDHYRNLAYPCSISGYQTFVIGTKVGSSDTATRPLWVRMRGGGVGYFDSQGRPQPSAGVKSEEPAATSIRFATQPGLMGLIRDDAAGFRIVSVSMCNHDIYAGGDQSDPNNPNTLPDGNGRTVNGLFATKAAIQYAMSRYPTSKTFLHGTSAGSAGALGLSWGLQEQGIPPAGTVADSGVVNVEWEVAANQQAVCSDGAPRSPEALAAIKARSHFQLADANNQPDKLVSRGELRVPILHTWSSADPNVCGAAQMACPLRDGTTATMNAADCVHEPLRAAIAGLGSGSRSVNMRLCISPADAPGSCATHVVTSRNGPHNTPMLDWVHARLAD